MSITTDPSSPAFVSSAVKEMSEVWDLIDDLNGGTVAMRKAGAKWLPPEEHEEDTEFQMRLKRSFLYSAYSVTVGKLASRPFSKLVTLEGIGSSWPWWLENIYNNANKSGDSVTAVLHSMFGGGIDYGLSHVLVDYTSGRVPNRSEERNRDVRSVWRYTSPRSVIGWRDEVVAGEQRLTQLRLREKSTLPEGLYGEKEVEIITVWDPQWIRKWIINDKQELEPYGEPIKHTFGRVPLETFYTNRTGFMRGKPPLEDLAWLNVAHWQSDSQQRNILRFARIGFLLLTGITEDEYEDGFKLGPGATIRCTNKDANGKYVEYQGGAIPHGKADLDDLERRMAFLGLVPMVSQANYATAFGRQVDENKQYSELQLWIEEAREVAKNCFKISYRNQNVEPPKSLDVQYSYDASLGARNLEYVRYIVDMVMAEKIPFEEGYKELKTLGVFSENFDVQAVAQKIERLRKAQVQEMSNNDGTQREN